jgi:hypothetical protein
LVDDGGDGDGNFGVARERVASHRSAAVPPSSPPPVPDFPKPDRAHAAAAPYHGPSIPDAPGCWEGTTSARSLAQSAVTQAAQRVLRTPALVYATASAIATAVASDAVLREAIRRYATCLRDEGEPPERALVLVKAAVRDAVASDTPTGVGIMLDAVRWAIDGYYAA